jgi:hypothetical protein
VAKFIIESINNKNMENSKNGEKKEAYHKPRLTRARRAEDQLSNDPRIPTLGEAFVFYT